MKILKVLALGFVMSSLAACGSEIKDQFLPDNDLWKYDNLYSFQSGKSEANFRKIASDLKIAYASEAKKNNEIIIVNALWEDKNVNADCSRTKGKVTINLYGGLYRNISVNPQAFAIVASHEASHAWGGAPFYKGETLSTEGNSDYMATKVGYWKLAVLEPSSLIDKVNPSSFIKKTCSKYYGRFADNRYNICLNLLIGGESLAELLASLNDDPAPNYETPDPFVTKKTIESYPKTTQCRLDSMLNGAIGLARPVCWYKP